ncbi:hypothetical protein TNCV_292001 [Trichonephila clavipes]|nr:hypothetical protein TNCV_292001 [Trichonephila clavipes]
MSESRIKLCGHNKNISFLIGDGVCRQGKVMRQHPKQGQFSKTEQSNASASQVRMVSKDRVKLYGYNKSVNFSIEDGLLRLGKAVRQHPKQGQFSKTGCQVIYSQFGLAIHQNDHQARRRFVQWAQNEIAVVPDFHKRILFSDEAHFWLNGYVNKQNCRIWSEANPQVYVETPLHPEKLTVWCALWAGGIIGPYFFKKR